MMTARTGVAGDSIPPRHARPTHPSIDGWEPESDAGSDPTPGSEFSLPGHLSIFPSRAAFDPKVTPHMLRVYAALSSYADRQGWCFPAQATIGKKLGLTRQAIGQHLARLEALGYLSSERQRGPNGGETSKRYKVLYYEDDSPPASPKVAPHESLGLAPPESALAFTNVPSNEEQEERTSVNKTRVRATQIDDVFRADMVTKYAGVLSAERVNSELDDALGHNAATKRSDLKAYGRNWLAKAAEHATDRVTTRRASNGRAPAVDGLDQHRYDHVVRRS